MAVIINAEKLQKVCLAQQTYYQIDTKVLTQQDKTMNKSGQKFGQLLTEGLYTLKLREDKPLGLLQDELGYAIGRSGGTTIAHWRRGNVPANYHDLECLVREMVKRGGLGQNWVEQLLAQTEFSPKDLSSELFAELGTTAPAKQFFVPHKDYKQLVGRGQLTKEIMAVLVSPDPPNIISIDGQGGIGKTALVTDIADLCRRKGVFDDFIWLNAAHQPGALAKTEYAFTFETILDTIGYNLGQAEFAKISLAEKKRLIQDHLLANRMLIVLDNLETAVQPQNDIILQLQPLLGRSKAILTSRHRFRQNSYAIHLTGLENQEASHLIHQCSQTKGIHHIQSATVEEIDNIIWATGGSPLAIQLVVSQLHHLPLSVVLKNLRQITPLSQIADEGEYVKFYKFVFQHSWSLLNYESKTLLVALAHFTPTNGANFEAIQHISEIDWDTLVACIEKLWDSSLLEIKASTGVNQIRYYLHPLTQNFVFSDIAIK